MICYIAHDMKNPDCPWCHGTGHVEAVRPDGSTVRVLCSCTENIRVRYYASNMDCKWMELPKGSGRGFVACSNGYSYCVTMDKPVIEKTSISGVFSSVEEARRAFEEWNTSENNVWDEAESEKRCKECK